MGASIRVVANRTGIGAATLRVWERRYEFPRPSRRPGGSRVYSEADIARLHVITRALAAGFRPSEVVSLALDALAKLVDASVAAEERVVDAVGVGLDVAFEASKHRAHGVAPCALPLAHHGIRVPAVCPPP